MKSSTAAVGARPPRQHCSCPWCGNEFKSKSKMKLHVGEVHRDDHANQHKRAPAKPLNQARAQPSRPVPSPAQPRIDLPIQTTKQRRQVPEPPEPLRQRPRVQPSRHPAPSQPPRWELPSQDQRVQRTQPLPPPTQPQRPRQVQQPPRQRNVAVASRPMPPVPQAPVPRASVFRKAPVPRINYSSDDWSPFPSPPPSPRQEAAESAAALACEPPSSDEWSEDSFDNPGWYWGLEDDPQEIERLLDECEDDQGEDDQGEDDQGEDDDYSGDEEYSDDGDEDDCNDSDC